MKAKRIVSLLLVMFLLFPTVLLEGAHAETIALRAPIAPHGRWINGARPNYIVHSDFGAQTMADFNSAMATWNNRLGFTKITRNPTTRHSRSFTGRSDGINSVYRVQWGTGPNIPVAFAEVFYLGTTGGQRRIVEVDIGFNMSYGFHNNSSPGSSNFDVWTVMAHEAGHVLGLSDHRVSRDAVMFAQIDPAERRRQPTALDVMHLDVLNYRAS